MLESDWLTNILRCAIIFRETHGERSSRPLSTALQFRITSPNDFSYFKRSYNSNTTKTNKTLAKYINIVSNGIKTADHLHVLPQNYVLLCSLRTAHTLFLLLSLPYRHTVYTHKNIRANVVSAALTTSVNSLAT